MHDPRSQMRRCGAFGFWSWWCGDGILFERESDLDIYIEKRGHGADAFGTYLVDQEGYKLV